MARIKYRVSGDWRGAFSTFERALRRARVLRATIGESFEVLEIDAQGNETPVALVAHPKRELKILREPSMRYASL